jgi:2-haloacid dehalogenase
MAGGFRAPSTGTVVRAVLFDTFGTVVDWRSCIAAAVGEFAAAHGRTVDPAAVADAWRARYQPAMHAVRSGARPFALLDVLHRENLDDVLRAQGLDPVAFDGAELDELSRAWHFLPPWPDSVPGITQIKAGYVVGPLSNGNTALLVDMAKAAGLPWDLILGSDVTRAYKPDPAAYRRPAEYLGLDPSQIMLVAAHAADLAAARDAGLATAFVARPAEYGASRAGTASAGTATENTATGDTATENTQAGDWDLNAISIVDLACQL